MNASLRRVDTYQPQKWHSCVTRLIPYCSAKPHNPTYPVAVHHRSPTIHTPINLNDKETLSGPIHGTFWQVNSKRRRADSVSQSNAVKVEVPENEGSGRVAPGMLLSGTDVESRSAPIADAKSITSEVRPPPLVRTTSFAPPTISDLRGAPLQQRTTLRSTLRSSYETTQSLKSPRTTPRTVEEGITTSPPAAKETPRRQSKKAPAPIDMYTSAALVTPQALKRSRARHARPTEDPAATRLTSPAKFDFSATECYEKASRLMTNASGSMRTPTAQSKFLASLKRTGDMAVLHGVLAVIIPMGRQFSKVPIRLFLDKTVKTVYWDADKRMSFNTADLTTALDWVGVLRTARLYPHLASAAITSLSTSDRRKVVVLEYVDFNKSLQRIWLLVEGTTASELVALLLTIRQCQS